MTCAEFEAVLPELLEDGGTHEQRAHMSTCSGCSELVTDIQFISQQARTMRASDEPNPRVWNSIEIALRQEGLIREPGVEHGASSPRSFRQWTLAWLLPTTAAFLLTFGILRMQHPSASPQIASNPPEQTVAPAVAAVAAPAAAHPTDRGVDAIGDKQFLEVVSTRSPAMRASYETDLQNVNDYIRDAEKSAQANPGDEEAQEDLMNAYEQKAMVYQLAMDRSLQ